MSNSRGKERNPNVLLLSKAVMVCNPGPSTFSLTYLSKEKIKEKNLHTINKPAFLYVG